MRDSGMCMRRFLSALLEGICFERICLLAFHFWEGWINFLLSISFFVSFVADEDIWYVFRKDILEGDFLLEYV